jgi:hypothetical protein
MKRLNALTPSMKGRVRVLLGIILSQLAMTASSGIENFDYAFVDV